MPLSREQAKAIAEALVKNRQTATPGRTMPPWYLRRVLYGIGAMVGGTPGYAADRLLLDYLGPCTLVGAALGVFAAWRIMRRVG